MIMLGVCVIFISPSSAAIVAGPFTNPANGHVYYLLDQKGWIASEAEAITLGGHLVTINDAAEDAWVSSTFFPHANGDGNLWIGLNDAAVEGTFVWVSGEPVSYLNWGPSQPDNFQGGEDYTHIFGPGRAESPQWNDFNESGVAASLTIPHGVVEVVPSSIPTLGNYGQLILMVLLIGISFILIRKLNRIKAARS